MGVKFNPFTSKLDIVDSPSGEFSDIELALGTQTAPSLSFTGDPNTGIYSPGADQVALTTAGSERLRITSDGKLGVGTSSPDTNLEISSSNSKVRITDNDSASSGNCSLEWAFSGGRNGYMGYGGSNDLYIWQELNNKIIFGTNATSALAIDSSQRVGIGTTTVNANARLHTVGGNILVQGNGGANTASLILAPGSTPEDGVSIAVSYTGSGSYGPLKFGTGGPERARIDSSGYLRLSANSLGIQFNGDTAAANALDDYEEGTWTPVMEGTSSAGTGTYTQQIGSYTKIGNRVMFNCRVAWSAHTGTGDMFISGLPFSVGQFSSFAARVSGMTVSAGKFYVDQTSNKLVIEETLDTSADFIISGQYRI